MPAGTVAGCLVTVCADGICRIWRQSVLFGSTCSSAGPASSDDDDGKQEAYRQRILHVRQALHGQRAMRRQASRSSSRAGSRGGTPLPERRAVGRAAYETPVGLGAIQFNADRLFGEEGLEQMPSNRGPHDYHRLKLFRPGNRYALYHDELNSGGAGKSAADGHFYLAASVNPDSDLQFKSASNLTGTMASNPGTEQTWARRPELLCSSFSLHWLNNKEMWFDAAIMQQLCDQLNKSEKSSDDEDSDEEGNNEEDEDDDDDNNDNNGDNESEGIHLDANGESSPSKKDRRRHKSEQSAELSNALIKSTIDAAVQRLLAGWKKRPDLLYSIHPQDGSFLIWSVDWLDGDPSNVDGCSMRQVQVSCSGRIPSVMGPGDLLTLCPEILSFRSSVAAYLSSALDRTTSESLLVNDQVLAEERRQDATSQTVRYEKAQHPINLVATHRYGSLSLWKITFSEEREFNVVSSVRLMSRLGGHRFSCTSIVQHPVFSGVLLSTGHRCTDSSDERTVDDATDAASEVLLWFAGATGPLATTGQTGLTELCRSNGRSCNEFRAVQWLRSFLPPQRWILSESTGVVGEEVHLSVIASSEPDFIDQRALVASSSSGVFIGCDSTSELRLYQCLFDVRPLILTMQRTSFLVETNRKQVGWEESNKICVVHLVEIFRSNPNRARDHGVIVEPTSVRDPISSEILLNGNRPSVSDRKSGFIVCSSIESSRPSCILRTPFVLSGSRQILNGSSAAEARVQVVSSVHLAAAQPVPGCDVHFVLVLVAGRVFAIWKIVLDIVSEMEQISTVEPGRSFECNSEQLIKIPLDGSHLAVFDESLVSFSVTQPVSFLSALSSDWPDYFLRDDSRETTDLHFITGHNDGFLRLWSVNESTQSIINRWQSACYRPTSSEGPASSSFELHFGSSNLLAMSCAHANRFALVKTRLSQTDAGTGQAVSYSCYLDIYDNERTGSSFQLEDSICIDEFLSSPLRFDDDGRVTTKISLHWLSLQNGLYVLAVNVETQVFIFVPVSNELLPAHPAEAATSAGRKTSPTSVRQSARTVAAVAKTSVPAGGRLPRDQPLQNRRSHKQLVRTKTLMVNDADFQDSSVGVGYKCWLLMNVLSLPAMGNSDSSTSHSIMCCSFLGTGHFVMAVDKQLLVYSQWLMGESANSECAIIDAADVGPPSDNDGASSLAPISRVDSGSLVRIPTASRIVEEESPEKTATAGSTERFLSDPVGDKTSAFLGRSTPASSSAFRSTRCLNLSRVSSSGLLPRLASSSSFKISPSLSQLVSGVGVPSGVRTSADHLNQLGATSCSTFGSIQEHLDELARAGARKDGGSMAGTSLAGVSSASRKGVMTAADWANLVGCAGFFEVVHLLNAPLPQYHPRQLVQLLNFGKVRRVKAILAHLTRTLLGERAYYAPTLEDGRNSADPVDGDANNPSTAAPSSDEDDDDRSKATPVGDVSQSDHAPNVFLSEISTASATDSAICASLPISPLPLYALLRSDTYDPPAPLDVTVGAANVGGSETTAATTAAGANPSGSFAEPLTPVGNTSFEMGFGWDVDDSSPAGGKRTSRRRSSAVLEQVRVNTCNAFLPIHAQLLARQLTRNQLPGLSPLDQMYLLALCDTVASLDSDVLSSQMRRSDLASNEDRTKCGSHFQGLDECGIRFVVALKQHVYLLRTLPLGPRAELTRRGLSSSSYIWAFHSDAKQELLAVIPSVARGEPSWPELRAFGVGWWLGSVQTLRQVVEQLAKTAFQRSKDPLDAALYYLALRKKQLIYQLYRTVDDKKMQEFWRHDFTEKRWRDAATKNAYRLMQLQRFTHAAAFFLLAGRVIDCVGVLVDKLQDLQLALVVTRIYEATGVAATGGPSGVDETTGGSVSSTLHLILRRYVLGLDEKIPIKRSSDAFLRSAAFWTMGRYTDALDTLLDTKVANDGTPSTGAESTTASGPSVFVVYQFLRSHPLIKRQKLHQKTTLESTADYSSKATTTSSGVDCDLLSCAERALYFRTADMLTNWGCPMVALEALRQLPASYVRSEESNGNNDDAGRRSSTNTGGDRAENFDWSSSAFGAGGSGGGKAADFDWSQPLASSNDKADTFDWSTPLSTVGSSSAINGLEKSPLHTSAGPEATITETDDNHVDDSKRTVLLDWTVSQLKFTYCWQIICEEISSLVTGYEKDPIALRGRLNNWLENELQCLKELCLPSATGSNSGRQTETDSCPSSVSALAGYSAKDQQHIIRYGRLFWLRKHWHLLLALVDYLSLVAAGTYRCGASVVLGELLSLVHEISTWPLSELSWRRRVVTLSDCISALEHGAYMPSLPPIPLIRHLGLLGGTISPLADPIFHLRALVNHLLDSIGRHSHIYAENESSKQINAPSVARDRTHVLWYDVAVAISCLTQQMLSDCSEMAIQAPSAVGHAATGDAVGGSTSACGHGTHFPGYGFLMLSTSVDKGQSKTAAEHSNLHLATNTAVVHSESFRWPGLQQFALDISETQKRYRPFASNTDLGSAGAGSSVSGLKCYVVLAEAMVSAYVGLLASALLGRNALILFRLVSKPLTSQTWVKLVGGTCRVPLDQRPGPSPTPPPTTAASTSVESTASTRSTTTSGPLTAADQLRSRYNRRVIGSPDPSRRSSNAQSTQFAEHYVPPTLSLVNLVLFDGYPTVDARSRHEAASTVAQDSSDETDSESDREPEDDGGNDEAAGGDEANATASASLGRSARRRHEFAWLLLRIGACRLASAALKQFLPQVGLDLSDLAHASPRCRAVLETVDQWQRDLIATLDSWFEHDPQTPIESVGPPKHLLMSTRSRQILAADVDPLLGPVTLDDCLRILLDPRCTPFRRSAGASAANERHARNLWKFFVHDNSLKPLFVRYIFTKRRLLLVEEKSRLARKTARQQAKQSGLTNGAMRKAASSSNLKQSDRLQSDALAKVATSAVCADALPHAVTSLAVHAEEVARSIPMRLVHRENETINCFTLSGSSQSRLALATGRELSELDISALLCDFERTQKRGFSDDDADKNSAAWMADFTEFELFRNDTYGRSAVHGSDLTGSSEFLLVDAPHDFHMKDQLSYCHSGQMSGFGANLSGLTGSGQNSAVLPWGVYVLQRSRAALRKLKRTTINGIRCMVSHPLLPQYLIGCDDGCVQLHHFEYRESLSTPRKPGQAGRVTALNFSQLGNKFGAADRDGLLCVWAQPMGSVHPKCYWARRCHGKTTNAFRFVASSSSVLATAGISDHSTHSANVHGGNIAGSGASSPHNIALWDTLLPTATALVASFPAHEPSAPGSGSTGQHGATSAGQSGATCLEYNNRSQTLLSGGRRGDVCAIDLRQRRLLHSFTAHPPQHEITCLALDPLTRQLLATGCDNGDVKLWHLETNRELARFPLEHFKDSLFKKASQGVQWLQFSADSRSLLSCGADGSLKMRSIERLIRELV